MKAATSASMMVMAIGEKVLPSPPPEATSGASLGSLPMSEAPNASLLTMIILNGEGVEASGAGGFGGRGTGVSRAAAARFGRGLGAALFSGASAAGPAPETLNTDSPVGAMRWHRGWDHMDRPSN